MTKLAVVRPCYSTTNLECHLFLAEELIKSTSRQDETEDIKTKKIFLEEAMKLIDSFEIKDAGSIIAIQKLTAMIKLKS